VGVIGNKIKQVFKFIVTLAIGIAVGCYATMFFIGNFVEYGSVVQSLAQVKVNYWTLNDLQSGNVKGAVERLEIVTKSSIDYFEACDSVVCKNTESESIQEAINLFEKYESSK
jgi:hypothetical protein